MRIKLIFIVFLSFFITHAFASGGINEKQERELLKKVSCVSKTADRKKASDLKKHIEKFNLRDFELYQTIMKASDDAIDTSVINMLIRKFPRLKDKLFDVAAKKDLVKSKLGKFE